jgi:hypothetical protein
MRSNMKRHRPEKVVDKLRKADEVLAQSTRSHQPPIF